MQESENKMKPFLSYTSLLHGAEDCYGTQLGEELNLSFSLTVVKGGAN